MKMDVPELLAKAAPWYSAAAFAVVVLREEGYLAVVCLDLGEESSYGVGGENSI